MDQCSGHHRNDDITLPTRKAGFNNAVTIYMHNAEYSATKAMEFTEKEHKARLRRNKLESKMVETVQWKLMAADCKIKEF